MRFTPHVITRVPGCAPQRYNTSYYLQNPHAHTAQPVYQHHPSPAPPQQGQLQPDQWSYNLLNGKLQDAQQTSSRALALSFSNTAQYRAPRHRAEPCASTVSYSSSVVNPNSTHLSAAQQPVRNMPMKSAGASRAYRKAILCFTRKYHALFGVSSQTCSSAWNKIYNSLPQGSEPRYLLWACLFLKEYWSESVHCCIVNLNAKTFRKWVWIVLSFFIAS